MPQTVGTHDISFLLATRYQTVMQFGLERVNEILQADLAAHNRIVNEMMADFCVRTVKTRENYGSSETNDMVKVDEYARSMTQRAGRASTVGYPLELYQYAIGWTQKFLQVATPADLATAQLNAQKAHRRAIRREIKSAIFTPTNRSFEDYLIDRTTIPVKAFLNADSEPIPPAPDAETTFNAATHTHYDFSATLTTSALTALINDVTEHGHTGAVRVAFNLADELTVRALTGFKEYVDPRLIQLPSTQAVPGQRLDLRNMYNRPIGIYGAAEIWIKPWVPASYAFCWDAAAEKPLAFREREQEGVRGLRIASTLGLYPLVAQHQEAEFGIGVRTRTNGAVLYFGGGSYVTPVV